MKKYEVYVDSNGVDSLWFLDGVEVEKPLKPANVVATKSKQDEEDLKNYDLLRFVLGITGKLTKGSVDVTSSNDRDISLTESLTGGLEIKHKLYTYTTKLVD